MRGHTHMYTYTHALPLLDNYWHRFCLSLTKLNHIFHAQWLRKFKHDQNSGGGNQQGCLVFAEYNKSLCSEGSWKSTEEVPGQEVVCRIVYMGGARGEARERE